MVKAIALRLFNHEMTLLQISLRRILMLNFALVQGRDFATAGQLKHAKSRRVAPPTNGVPQASPQSR